MPTEVKSHLDTYTVYLENAQYRDIACIAALFIDGLECSSNDEIADSAIKEEYLSFNKELNSKFVAAFLERVRTNNMVKNALPQAARHFLLSVYGRKVA